MKKFCPAFILVSLLSSSAFAAGFEKTIMWGGKWSALGGAATSSVDGADSVFYNPAGLVHGSDREISLNFSPLLARTQGSQATSNEKITSDRAVKPIFGVLAKQKLNDQFALGAGFYVSGGASAEFEQVNYSHVKPPFTMRPEVKSGVTILEMALAGAYKITDRLSIGAAWRATRATAEFSSADVMELAPTIDGLIASQLKDFEGDDFGAYRIGLQYLHPSNNWGLGLTYRSAITLKLDGKGDMQLQSPDKKITVLAEDEDVTLESGFPDQVNFGGFYQVDEHLRLYAEFSWTQYSKNERVKLTSNGKFNGKDIMFNWEDTYGFKFGEEYVKGNFAYRLGYAATTRVTSKNDMNITLSAPGTGHTFGAGVGYINPKSNLKWDIAAEYSVAGGFGEKTKRPKYEEVSGYYVSRGYALHTTLKYSF